MEVIECDRCKKRIGEKGQPQCDAVQKVKVDREDVQVICAECGEKHKRFMAGEDDLRTVFQGVHPDTIKKVLVDVWRGTEDVDLDALSQKIIEALPNGGRF